MRSLLALSLALSMAAPRAGVADDDGHEGQGRSERHAVAPAGTYAVAPGVYAGVKAGAVIPQDADLKTFGDGMLLEAAAGYRLSSNLGFELAAGRFSMDGTQTVVYGTIPVAASETVIAYPLTASVKAMLPVGRMRLHALAGGGIYFISVKSEGRVGGSVIYGDSDSSSPLALHAGAGISLALSGRVELGAEVRYVTGNARIFDETWHFDSVLLGGMLTCDL